MSTSALKSYLSATLRRLLRSVVRIALRGEVTYREFADIAKLAYFDVARDDYGINGRKTNLARVAILTGLSRKECTRLKAVAAAATMDGGARSAVMSPVTRVISGWHETPEYVDAAGRPRTLPRTGPCPSLEDLFRRFAGDIPDGALMHELERVGAVEETGSGEVRVLKRSFVADGFSKERVRIVGNMYSDLGSTIVYNLDEANVDRRRIARYVVADAVAPDVAQAFQALAEERGQALLGDLDGWLSAEGRQAGPPASADARRVGLGVYFFEESLTEQHSPDNEHNEVPGDSQ